MAPVYWWLSDPADMLRICYVSSNYLVGGIEKLLYSLCSMLRKRNEIQVCLLRREGPFVEMIRQDFAQESRNLGFLETVRFLKAGGFDVVHSFGFRADLASRMSLHFGCKSMVVSSIANPDLKNSWVKRFTNSLASGRVQYFWADSLHRARAGSRRLGIPERKVRMIYPGVDPDDLERQAGLQNGVSVRKSVRMELNIPDEAPLLVSVGNLRYIKGHHLILKAAPIILRSYPQAVFAFVGADFTGGTIPQQAARDGLVHAVRFTGYRKDAVRYLAASDIVLQPSLSEGFPRAVLEAMALKRAVIATRVGGIPEMIEHGVSGCLTDPGSADGLASETLRILNDPGLSRRLGAAAGKNVRERFTQEQMIRQFEQLYEGSGRKHET